MCIRDRYYFAIWIRVLKKETLENQLLSFGEDQKEVDDYARKEESMDEETSGTNLIEKYYTSTVRTANRVCGIRLINLSQVLRKGFLKFRPTCFGFDVRGEISL
eukprot:TRINITY_DN3585_c0_g1_i3.p3 TRINITY_DN3585_c0_g1~~TRINITY_DN3585_c0_g1_i3.p3  ORF type:complete len:104 (+),score=5.96 TRINITY_DN3585_c0_g1_i3:66-377(+)